MKKVEIKLQTAKDIRNVLKCCICKDKKKHECDFAKTNYNRMTRELNCSLCPIKYLDNQLKNAIKGE